MGEKQLQCAIIAPAGAPAKADLRAGIEFLEENNIVCTIMPGVFKDNASCQPDGQHSETPHYLSNSIEKRIDDFHEAVANDTYDIIWCARGGYGSAQLLPHIDWNSLPRTTKPLIGYSDITVLQLACTQHDICTPIQAPMICDITKNKASLDTLLPLIEKKVSQESIQLTSLTQTSTTISGPIIGGTLSVIASMCGTPYLPSFENHILFIEDIGEDPYKLDRYLTQLLQNGALNKVSAVVCGSFTNCGEEKEIKQALQHSLKETGIALFWGFPFGHQGVFTPLAFRNAVTIDKSGILRFTNKHGFTGINID